MSKPRLRAFAPRALAMVVLLVCAPLVSASLRRSNTMHFRSLAAQSVTPTLFAPSSVWNAPVPREAALDPNSSALVQDLQRQRQRWASWINTTSNSTPIYTVDARQPAVSVRLDGHAPALSAAWSAVPIPAGARPAVGGDGNMVVWQPSTDTLWEFWHLTRQIDGWHAATGGRMLGASSSPGYYSDRVNPNRTYSERWFWGAPATSLSLAGGVIRIAELQRGRIDHALYLSIPQPRKGVLAVPAERTDGNLDSPDAIPEGAHLRLDPAVDLNALNLPPATRTIAEAAQRYGIVVNNVSGSISFRAEDPIATGTNPYPALFGGLSPNQLLASFPWSRLQVLKMGLRTATG